jgi:maltooligosyltrehalose trehalohydrolase
MTESTAATRSGLTNTSGFAHRLPFGAELNDDGTTSFRLWAPACARVTLDLQPGIRHDMTPRGGGWFSARVAAPAGTRYRFVLPDGLAVPDPASRLQDGDVHGWSVVVDPRDHAWKHPRWRGRPWREVVIYELHPGLMGGFVGIARHLERLRDLGVTAIELMPINEFPGGRNWGYDGVLPFAPEASYGTPGELKALIDDAHGLGLLVYLDVVYNHFGPDGAYMHVYAGDQFFDADRASPWGAAIAHERPEVADYFIQNAIYWLMEYRFDGLRFDAVGAILDPDFPRVMTERIRAAIEPDRHAHLVMEHEDNVASLIGDGRMDAQWTDDTHHCLHVLLTGETEGYYVDYKDAAAKLARCLSEGFAFQGEIAHKGKPRGEPSGHLPPASFVIFLQNHDQIGNRAMGERLTVLADPEALRAAQALLLLAPQIPLLFMGEEIGSRAPFLFFTDHHAELADQVREGRRREFAGFAAFADETRRAAIPDPNASATFELSRVDPSEADPETSAHIKVLLGLRHRHIAPRIDGAGSLGAEALGTTGVLARWVLGDGAELVLATNFGPDTLAVPVIDGPVLFESHPGDAARVSLGALPPRCTVGFLLERA